MLFGWRETKKWGYRTIHTFSATAPFHCNSIKFLGYSIAPARAETMVARFANAVTCHTQPD